jgi:hypothetical protein
MMSQAARRNSSLENPTEPRSHPHSQRPSQNNRRHRSPLKICHAKMENIDDAARLIQRNWRIHQFNKLLGSQENLLHNVVHDYQSHREFVRVQIKEIVLYTIFLACFTWLTMLEVDNAVFFHFAESVRSQLTKVEFDQKDAPTFNKVVMKNMLACDNFQHMCLCMLVCIVSKVCIATIRYTTISNLSWKCTSG